MGDAKLRHDGAGLLQQRAGRRPAQRFQPPQQNDLYRGQGRRRAGALRHIGDTATAFDARLPETLFAFAIAFFLVYTHRSNIQKMLAAKR